MTILLLAALALPSPTLTPGVVRPLGVKRVCTTKWGRDKRHVTVAMRKAVFKAYGVDWALRAGYEVDHLVPRELAGADTLRNLWPQPLTEARKIKDPLENRLHVLVCRGTLALKDAQAQMRGWGR